MLIISCFLCLYIGIILGVQKGKTMTEKNFLQNKNSVKEIKTVEKEYVNIEQLGKKYYLYKFRSDIDIVEKDFNVVISINNKNYHMTVDELFHSYSKFAEDLTFFENSNSHFNNRFSKVLEHLKSFNEKELYDTIEDAEIARNEIYVNKIR